MSMLQSFILAACLIMLLLPRHAVAEESPVFPGEHWATKAPAEAGLDAAQLDRFRERTMARDGCVIRHGYLVYAWGNVSEPQQWGSAIKPVNSTMLLFAMKEGRVQSPDDPVRPWVQKVFPGNDLLEKDRTMTFRHLCNMTSGYALPEAPGAAWGYNDRGIALKQSLLYGLDGPDGPFGVFGEEGRGAQGSPERLGALQFEDAPRFGGRTHMSVRDFARIGWFWRNRGNWQGRQLLPRDYFDANMRSRVPADLPRTQGGMNDYLPLPKFGGGTNQTPHGPGAYGFNWWFNPGRCLLKDVPEDIIHANGHWNKRTMTVFPSLDAVVAWNEGPWAEDGEGPNVIPNLNAMLSSFVAAVKE